jgi:hypothetical protein
MIYRQINNYLNELNVSGDCVNYTHGTLNRLWQRFGRERIDSILEKLWTLKAEKKKQKELAFCREWVKLHS